MKDIEEVEDRNEAIILIGDMNRAIGNGDSGVKGNNNKISAGGLLIRNMIRERQYVIVNNLDIVQGGPWTRVDRQDSRRKSVLDLCIISTSLLPYITRMEVDTEQKFTPRRVTKTKKGIKTTYTDHYSLKVELKGIPRKIEHTTILPTWNLNKPGGWDIYNNITNSEAEKIKEIITEDG